MRAHTFGSYPESVAMSRRTSDVGELAMRNRRVTARKVACSGVNASLTEHPLLTIGAQETFAVYEPYLLSTSMSMVLP
jgi:hypothetical protein